MSADVEKRSERDGNDDELILRTRQGDRHAFGVLVTRYQKKVYFLAMRMVKDHDAADDIAQETFIRAYRAIDSFKVGSNLFTWLYRICVNLSINHLNKEKRTVAASSLGEGDMTLERMEKKNPLDCVSEAEMKSKIDMAIQTLSPKYKAVFVLRIFESMSYEEIAESLNMSVGTVMSRLFRAREKIREILKEYRDWNR
jgi:RNA polymerase sigma-70 factor (ECF subfamily)